MPGERNLGRHKLDWSEKAEVTFTLFPSCGGKVTEDKDWVGSEARKSSEVTIYTICLCSLPAWYNSF